MKRLFLWGVIAALAGLLGTMGINSGEGYVFLMVEEQIPGHLPAGWGEEAFEYLWSPTEGELILPRGIPAGWKGMSMVLHLAKGEGQVRGRLWPIPRGGGGVRLAATGDVIELRRMVQGGVLLEYGRRRFWLSPGDSWGTQGSLPQSPGEAWTLRLFNLGLWPGEVPVREGGR